MKTASEFCQYVRERQGHSPCVCEEIDARDREVFEKAREACAKAAAEIHDGTCGPLCSHCTDRRRVQAKIRALTFEEVMSKHR